MNIKKIAKLLLPTAIKRFLKARILLQKSPTCVFYKNVNLCLSTKFGKYVVVFENTQIAVSSFIDDYTYIQKDTLIFNTGIGKFCSIAKNVTIGLIGHPTDMVSTNPCFYDYEEGLLPRYFTSDSFSKEILIPKTNIESDVWIGQNVMIKPGITIGVGAVVGAGAVVTKNVEPYSVVAGVPAKHIKYRFEQEMREKLLASKWWTFGEEKLTKMAPYFGKPEIFLEKLKDFDAI